MKIKNGGTSNTKKNLVFYVMWVVFALALFIRFYSGEVNGINATMFAFSYKYGFISRGLVGTFFQVLDKILPFNLMNYQGTLLFVQVATALFYLVLFLYFILCTRRTKEDVGNAAKYVMLFLTIFAVPMFCNVHNFGRLDIFCVMLSLLSAMLLIAEKAEWLCILFSAVSVMIHQGNVFMFLNVVLVLLVYKMLTKTGKERRKYFLIFAGSFLSASALFLWFELFSHFQGDNIYEELVSCAQSLCLDGKIHSDVIDHEILGVDLTAKEWPYHMENFVQFPIFCVLMLPYILLTVRLFRSVIKAAETKVEKWKYVIVAIGAGTIVPDLLLKVDYGRWMFSIICYYTVVILALLAMGDRHVCQQMSELEGRLREKGPMTLILLMYPILLQPLMDISICEVVRQAGLVIIKNILHWW